MSSYMIEAGEVARMITLRFEFRGAKVMAVRFWMAGQLCRLVGWVAGTQVEIAASSDQP